MSMSIVCGFLTAASVGILAIAARVFASNFGLVSDLLGLIIAGLGFACLLTTGYAYGQYMHEKNKHLSAAALKARKMRVQRFYGALMLVLGIIALVVSATSAATDHAGRDGTAGVVLIVAGIYVLSRKKVIL